MTSVTHQLSEFKKFAEEFSSESDRAAVILGAAKLDILLFQLLQKVLRPSTTRNDELLEGDSPLGTFSSRALLCHRLGLIDDELFRSINLVRRIRNSFAHELSGVSLETGAHRDRIRELVSPMRDHGAFQWLTTDIYQHGEGPSKEFRVAVALISLRLEGAFDDQKPIYERNPMTLMPPEWNEESLDRADAEIAAEETSPAKKSDA